MLRIAMAAPAAAKIKFEFRMTPSNQKEFLRTSNLNSSMENLAAANRFPIPHLQSEIDYV
jgi:hypothetical protein